MKKTAFKLILLKKLPLKVIIASILFSAVLTGAAAQKQPKVYFGSFGQVNGPGGPKAFVSTRATLLSNNRLKYSEGCELIGYTVSILPKGGGIKGPMASCTPAFPERIKDKIVELGTDAIVYVENLKLNCYDMPVEILPFTIKYEQ